MKRCIKVSASMLVVVMFITTSFMSVNAAELLSGRRWNHMSYGSNGPRCDILVNDTYLSGEWDNEFSRSVVNWRMYSDNKVSIYYEPYASSNIDLYTYSQPWPYGPSTIGFTTIYDQYTNAYNGGITVGSVSDSAFGSRIASASVIFNPDYASGGGWLDDRAMNRAKTITHELGHCINLGHVADGVQSIMLQGWNLGWSDYDRPQDVDRYFLNSYYNQIYY